MCLILLAYQSHPKYRLILAANRDEFYNRPTEALHFWPDKPGILAGRDLEGGGTWLGVNQAGCFGAITNFRDPSRDLTMAPSRGALVTNFLAGTQSASGYGKNLMADKVQYNGYNLLIGDRSKLFYGSNRRGKNFKALKAGIYGLSNRFLNTPWPKVNIGKRRLAEITQKILPLEIDDLWAVLQDRTQPQDHLLPNTGIGLEWEKILAPIFIQSPQYGTRSSTVLLIDKNGYMQLYEITYDTQSHDTQKNIMRNFNISPVPNTD